MTTIKTNDTNTIYELPYDVTAEIMGALYNEPTDEDTLDGIDARFDTTDEVVWIAKLYAVMEEIDSALADADEQTTEAVNELYGTSDWEDVQRGQCEILGLDYDGICDEVNVEDYAC